MEVRACARPILAVHEEASDRAVVCLHGYMGYPGELALPAQRLYEAGFDVFVPRYPGHGTNGRDFMGTTRNDWIGEAERAVVDAMGAYGEVFLVGHSMGGAIATILSKRYGIRRTVLYAPALLIPSLPFTLVSIVSLFIKRRPQPWQSDPRYPFFDDRDPDDDAFLGKEYWSWLYPKQIRQLELLRREAVSLLQETSTDMLVITGGQDQVVHKDVGHLVVDTGSGTNEWLHLEQATHLIPYDIDQEARETAMERTIWWLSQ